MSLPPETSEDVLLKFLRGTPRSTQACRDHLSQQKNLKSPETEELLAELRDEGAIAFANGEWYVLRSTRATTRKGPRKKPHPRQTDFFDNEAGHQPDGPSKQALLFAEQWRAGKR
jgi:hypothetical protein